MYLVVNDRLFLLICRLLDNLNIFAVGLIKLQIPYHRQDQDVYTCAGILNNPSIFS